MIDQIHTPELSTLNPDVWVFDHAKKTESFFEGYCIGKYSALHLEFNECHIDYKSVLDAVTDPYSDEYQKDWITVEDRVKACEEDRMWTLYCWPQTPVGHFRLRASSLAVIASYLERNT